MDDVASPLPRRFASSFLYWREDWCLHFSFSEAVTHTPITPPYFGYTLQKKKAKLQYHSHEISILRSTPSYAQRTYRRGWCNFCHFIFLNFVLSKGNYEHYNKYTAIKFQFIFHLPLLHLCPFYDVTIYSQKQEKNGVVE